MGFYLIILIPCAILLFIVCSHLLKEFIAIKSHNQAGYFDTILLYFLYTTFKIIVAWLFFKLCYIIYINSGGRITGRGSNPDSFVYYTYSIHDGSSSLAALLAFVVYGLLVFFFFFILNRIFSIKLFIYNILFFIILFFIFGYNSPGQKTPYEKLMEKMHSDFQIDSEKPSCIIRMNSLAFDNPFFVNAHTMTTVFHKQLFYKQTRQILY